MPYESVPRQLRRIAVRDIELVSIAGSAAARIVVLLAVFLSLLAARSQATPLVLVTIIPQAFFVDQLAQGEVKTATLIPKGASAETFEPSIVQLRAASSARLYLRLGHPNFPLERTWSDTLHKDNPKLRVVDVIGSPLGADPHVWLSPQGALEMARSTHLALKQEFPELGVMLDDNLASIEELIQTTELKIKELLSGHAGRTFLTYHPAWGHFASAFSLKQLSIEQDGKEPSPSMLAKILREARASRITTIFVQPQFPIASAKMVAEELGASLATIDELAYDWPANMLDVANKFKVSFAGGSVENTA
ncbi:MAG: hypothetical protein DCC75_05410 [Proteobacteria bacterium]|nr:MAG: hypothetical protein DCC75_05410 [Pseudomonadota bacterium]